MNWFKSFIHRKRRILVIEDDVQIAMLLSLFLKKHGFRVDWGKDGLEGWEKFQAAPPDLVLLDITMPRMSGFEVLEKIKTNPKNSSVPVVMCTDHTTLKDVEGSNMLGAGGYILKPFDLDRVLAKVRSVLEGR